MVRKLLDYLSRDISGLHNAAYLLAFSALLSQILGVIRDRLLASHFGAGSTLDIYYAAFRIPDFLFVSIGSLISVSILIPFIIEYHGDAERRRRFINSVFSFFTLLFVVVAGAAFFAAPYLVAKLFPGFSPSALAQTIELTRILLLSPLLLGLSNLCGSLVQAYQKFALYAVSPLLYNIGIIIGILAFYPSLGLSGLAWGVALGALLHLGIQVPYLLKEGLLPRFSGHFDWRDMGKVLTTSLPRSLSLSLNQLTVIALTFFASAMGTGSISVFNFAFNLQSVPLSIIAVSYSVAAFPVLSRLFSGGAQAEFLRHITLAARHIIFWSLPAVVLLIVLRAQVVRSVLGAGAFDWTDTRLTAAALAFFVLSLIPQGLTLLFARGYYASGNTKIPLITAFVGACATVASASFLSGLFGSSPAFRHFVEVALRVEDLPQTVMLVLPLSYSIGMTVNALLLSFFFKRHFASVFHELSTTILQSLFASIMGGVSAYGALIILADYLDLDTFIGIFTQGALAGILGVAVLAMVLAWCKNSEFMEIKSALRRKLSADKVVGQEASEL